MDKGSFTQMKDGTKEDYEFLTAHEIDHPKHTARRLLKALVELDEGLSGNKLPRLGHSVQSATRAWRDGAVDGSPFLVVAIPFGMLFGAVATGADAAPPRLVVFPRERPVVALPVDVPDGHLAERERE